MKLSKRGVADEQEVPPAAIDEVAPGKLAAEEVVTADDTVVGILGLGAPYHEWRTGCRKVVEHLLAMALAEDDEPVGATRVEHLSERGRVVVVRRAQQQVLVAVAERFRNAGKQVEDEWVGDVVFAVRTEVERDGNRVGALVPELLRIAIDRVAVFISHGKHVVARFLVDQRAVGKGPRHGRFRHVREPRDVGHRDRRFPCFAHLHSRMRCQIYPDCNAFQNY